MHPTFRDFKQKLVIISIVLWEDHCNYNLWERICEDRQDAGRSNRTLLWMKAQKQGGDNGGGEKGY